MQKGLRGSEKRRLFSVKSWALLCARRGKRAVFQCITAANIVAIWALARQRRALFSNATKGLGLSAGDVVMVIVPHPDDETFGMGATLAALTTAGVHVHLLLLTDGSLSGAGILGPLPANERA
ncbi:MAG: PIG-L family deacetylase, partial [Methylococcales bacterium]|nr:PIG-L family deacetylase [Methylococcales bacterium]